MDRFKLEDAIMQCWTTKEDLMLLAKRYADHPQPMTEDQVVNAIHGIASVHELRCDELFEVFKQTFKLDNYKWMRDHIEDAE